MLPFNEYDCPFVEVVKDFGDYWTAPYEEIVCHFGRPNRDICCPDLEGCPRLVRIGDKCPECGEKLWHDEHDDVLWCDECETEVELCSG